tara:strand:+ start:1181 stop:1495 length:315 start_codon:yes stop_codon:yes gene_type:complete
MKNYVGIILKSWSLFQISKTTELLLNAELPLLHLAMNKFSPSHYQRGKIQVWDFIADQELDFFTGNVIKYVCRAGHKDQEGELDDLKKAKVYIDKKIALYNDRT